MKKGLVIIGIILLVVGLLMMLLLWPMVGTIDDDEMSEKMEAGEKGTFTVVDELSDEDWEGIKAIKDNETMLAAYEAVAGEGVLDEVDGPGTYMQRVEITDTEVKFSKMQKVPTMGGILGLVLLIVGVILMLVGFVTGKAAPAPPMEQPPMDQPPMEDQPPMPPQ